MKHRFDKQGILAIEPQAFAALYPERTNLKNQTIGQAEIVCVEGPLVQRSNGWADSYDAILGRVAAACLGPAKTIVLKVDSAGGDLAGMAETTRAIRTQCREADKRLIAYVDGKACSAAYALASAASEIVASDTALVGSIGVLNARIDLTESDKAMGLSYALVASGKKKLHGNPHVPVSDAELADTQSVVDSLAAIFFGLVGEMRDVAPEAIASLEAGCFHGEMAIKAGLVDRIQTFDAMLASLAEEKVMNLKASAEDIDEARKALERAAEGEGEEAERAKRALKALDAADEEEKEEEAEDKKDEPTASSDDDKKAESEEEKKEAKSHVSASTAGDMARTLSALSRDVAQLKAEKEGLERSNLLASRPDLAKELVALLQTKPLVEVRELVASIPKPETPKHAATAVVGGTRGGTHQGLAPNAWLDEQMGLTAETAQVRREGNAMVFDVLPKTRIRTEKVKS